MRTVTAYLVAPVMKLTGYRFDKSFRHAETGWKALVYRCCSTVKANGLAGF